MRRRGFTLIEIVIVMGIVAILLGFTTINMVGAQKRATLHEIAETLLADMRSQQTKAMTGITVGGVVPPGFGVRFESDRYVLFSGSSYSISNPTNIIITLPTTVSIGNVEFGADTVIFSSGSGEVVGFVADDNSFTIAEEGGDVRIIELNKYGVVTRSE